MLNSLSTFGQVRSKMCLKTILLVLALYMWGVFVTLGVIGVDTKVVDTKSGPVRGLLEISQRKSVEFYAFRGIPYAKPPVGDLRLKVKLLGIY